MRSEDERSFSAEDPVARYWLHNCVGFRVRGLGFVDEIASGENGDTVLAVRRLGMTTPVSTERVESIDPWAETIVLRPREHEARERSQAALTAARTATIFTAAVLGRFFALVARLLLALAAFVRRHAPGARERAGRVAATLAVVGRAYATEAARACRAQSEAVKAWRDERRRAAWGDESPPTRAGADDDVDARREERSASRRRVGR